MKIKRFFCTLVVTFVILVVPETSQAASLELIDSQVLDDGVTEGSTYFGIRSKNTKTGDLNNDGYLDVVFGDENYDSYTGRVVIYYGSSDGIQGGSPNVTLNIINSGNVSVFGSSIEIADISGDGVDDLLVGEFGYGYNGANIDTVKGRIHIYYGGSTFDNSEDVVLVGEDTSGLGLSLAVGDFNGDGWNDVLSGAQFFQEEGVRIGKVYMFEGPISQGMDSSWSFVGSASDVYGVGQSVVAADINKDGYDDWFVGAAFNNTVGSSAGKVYGFYGGETYPVSENVSILAVEAKEYFGRDTHNLGDINGDGFDDVSISAEDYGVEGEGTEWGRIHLSLAKDTLTSTADKDYYGETASSFFGRQGVGLGDLDNDGYNEYAFGAYGYPDDAKKGKAYIYKGGSSLPDDAEWTLDGENDGDRFSNPLYAGDYNQNGWNDMIVYAYGYPDGTRMGKLYLYEISHGSPEISVSSKDENNISGRATETINLKGVQWSVDSNDPKGTWHACVAEDGSFDSLDELFECDISSIGEVDKTYYLRTYDENDVFMPQALYQRVRIGRAEAPPSTPQVKLNPSGKNKGGLTNPEYTKPLA